MAESTPEIRVWSVEVSCFPSAGQSISEEVEMLTPVLAERLAQLGEELQEAPAQRLRGEKQLP